MRHFNSKYINTAALSDQDAYHIYNGLDSMMTMEVNDCLHRELATTNYAPHIYHHERSLLAPVMTMMRRGILVDPEARDRAALGPAGLDARIAKVQATLDAFAMVVWGKPINVNSHVQLKKFFFEELAIPVITASKKGEVKVSMDRDALEKIVKNYTRGMPFANLVLRLRDLQKQRDVLTKGLDDDERWRCSFNIGGTETGRFSSSASPFRTGCVPGDTEIFTENGWIRIDSWRGEEIADVDVHSNFEMTFSKPKAYHVYDNASAMQSFKSNQFSAIVTNDHKLPYRHPGRVSWFTRRAEDLCGNYDFPVSCVYNDGLYTFTEAELRLMVACLADGSLEHDQYRLGFKKPRKIERFLRLCGEAGFIPKEQVAPKGYRRFAIPKNEAAASFTGDVWGKWVLQLSHRCAKIVLDEIQYWDGHTRNQSYWFFNAHKEQAEWVHTLAHLHGMSGTLIEKNNCRGYNKNVDAKIYYVNIKPRMHVQIMAKKHKRQVVGTDKVYCFTTKSGFFLIRHEGKISVTGNSNLQNIDPALRYIFVPDPGYRLCYLDLQGAEARAVAYLSGDEAYIDAVESSDCHTLVAAMVFGIANDRSVAEQPFYRGFSYRDMSKRGQHGSNYYGTPRTMATHLKVETTLMESFQAAYFRRFPGIRRWHEAVAKQLQSEGWIETPFGRRRYFWSRLRDDTTLREAIAFVPQSLIADTLNAGLLRVWQNLEPDLQLFAQIHDALVFQVPLGPEGDTLIKEAKRLMHVRQQVVDINGIERTMEIPVDVEVGFNWGKANADNPNGLRKWKEAA